MNCAEAEHLHRSTFAAASWRSGQNSFVLSHVPSHHRRRLRRWRNVNGSIIKIASRHCTANKHQHKRAFLPVSCKAWYLNLSLGQTTSGFRCVVVAATITHCRSLTKVSKVQTDKYSNFVRFLLKKIKLQGGWQSVVLLLHAFNFNGGSVIRCEQVDLIA